MLDESDLGPADRALLDLLHEGRVTAPFAADESGYSLQYTRDRLGRLVEHGNARKVYEGLYELVEDPRESEENEPVPEVHRDSADSNVDDIEARMRAALEDLDVPGRPQAVEDTRREAIAWAWRRLRKAGEMKPKELADETFAEFGDDPNLNYSASESRHDGYQLLDNCLRDAVTSLPGVQQAGRAWVFVDE